MDAYGSRAITVVQCGREKFEVSLGFRRPGGYRDVLLLDPAEIADTDLDGMHPDEAEMLGKALIAAAEIARR